MARAGDLAGIDSPINKSLRTPLVQWERAVTTELVGMDLARRGVPRKREIPEGPGVRIASASAVLNGRNAGPVDHDQSGVGRRGLSWVRF
jgi:hypothetical protein